MNKAFRFAAVLGLALGPCALAQAPPDQPAAAPAPSSAIPPDQQPTKEQLIKLFELMRLREQLQSFMKMMPPAMQQQVQAQAQEMASKLPAGRVLTSEQQAAIEKVTNKYMEKALNVYPIDEMLDDLTAIYQHHINRSDVDAFIVFYSSPAGQHLLDEQPAIMKEYMPIAMKRAQDRSKVLTADLTRDLEELIKSSAQDKPAAK